MERMVEQRRGGEVEGKRGQSLVDWIRVYARVCSSAEERGAAMIYDSRLSKRDENDQTI